MLEWATHEICGMRPQWPWDSPGPLGSSLDSIRESQGKPTPGYTGVRLRVDALVASAFQESAGEANEQKQPIFSRIPENFISSWRVSYKNHVKHINESRGVPINRHRWKRKYFLVWYQHRQIFAHSFYILLLILCYYCWKQPYWWFSENTM